MRIILEVDDTTVALSITALRIYGIETSIGSHCLNIQGADGKIIVIPNEGKAEIKEADEDAKANRRECSSR